MCVCVCGSQVFQPEEADTCSRTHKNYKLPAKWGPVHRDESLTMNVQDQAGRLTHRVTSLSLKYGTFHGAPMLRPSKMDGQATSFIRYIPVSIYVPSDDYLRLLSRLCESLSACHVPYPRISNGVFPPCFVLRTETAGPSCSLPIALVDVLQGIWRDSVARAPPLAGMSWESFMCFFSCVFLCFL